jgi:hypothetical protein
MEISSVASAQVVAQVEQRPTEMAISALKTAIDAQAHTVTEIIGNVVSPEVYNSTGKVPRAPQIGQNVNGIA